MKLREEKIKRLLAIEGHRSSMYGQGSYDGDFCRVCGWQGGKDEGVDHTAETRKAAFVALLKTYGIEVI